MHISIICIYVDLHNNILGVRISFCGVVKDITFAQLLSFLMNGAVLDNAVLVQGRSLRAKSGTLKRVVINNTLNTVERSDQIKAGKLIGFGIKRLYHGSKNSNLKPRFGVGRRDNDYGSGFYLTGDIKLAKEWAWSFYNFGTQGYLYSYDLDMSGLNVLDFTRLDVIAWVAELLFNRKIDTFGDVETERTINRLIKYYKIDTSSFDIIVGYRADDSYFRYARAFVDGKLSRDALFNAMRLGKLGIQVFVKSRLAFSRLVRIGDPDLVPVKYQVLFKRRDDKARMDYNMLLASSMNSGSVTVRDYLRACGD